jgi:hypothetical protein
VLTEAIPYALDFTFPVRYERGMVWIVLAAYAGLTLAAGIVIGLCPDEKAPYWLAYPAFIFPPVGLTMVAIGSRLCSR